MANPQNNEESSILAMASLGAIFYFPIPLIMWLLKKDTFSDYTKNFLTDLLNFEIVVGIISIVLTFVPYFSLIASPIVFFVNLIISIRCYTATKERAPYSFPVNVKLIS